MRLPIKLALLAAAFTLAGCATGRTLGPPQSSVPLPVPGADRPEFYAGHRLNMAAIRGDGQALGEYYARGIDPPEHPLLDLAPSFAADTLMVPLVVIARVDDSINDFVDLQFYRYPSLRIGAQLPATVMAAPFYAAKRTQEYLSTQLSSLR